MAAVMKFRYMGDKRLLEMLNEAKQVLATEDIAKKLLEGMICSNPHK